MHDTYDGLTIVFTLVLFFAIMYESNRRGYKRGYDEDIYLFFTTSAIVGGAFLFISSLTLFMYGTPIPGISLTTYYAFVSLYLFLPVLILSRHLWAKFLTIVHT
jgi:hypothetical protein